MNEIILKIPKRRSRVRVIKTKEELQDYINRKKKESEEALLDEEIKKQKQRELEEEEEDDVIEITEESDAISYDEEENEEEITEKKKEIFTEKYSISGAGKPLEISMDKIEEDTLTLDEVMIEVQNSYDRGFNDGKEAANVAYQSEISKYSDWIRKIDVIAEEMEQKFSTELKNFSDMLVKTTLIAAKKIIDREISKDSEIIISQVKKALRDIDENDTVIKISVHPHDFEILEKVKSKLIQDDQRVRKSKIIADPKVERGGCILTTMAGEIDARISVQLNKISEILKDSIEETQG